MKNVFYLLVIILLNALTSASIYAQTSFSGGTGTEQDPFKITTAAQLQAVKDFCGTDHKDKHFRLMNSITLPSFPEWIPIGNAGCKFTGHFNGGKNTITGLTITVTNTTTDNYIGLFGYNEGTIDSLTVEGSIYKKIQNEQYVGGLAGYNAGTINYCHADVTIAGGSFLAASYAGGLVGLNSGKIQSSSAAGIVSASGSISVYSGGLVGNNSGNVSNCFATGQTVYSEIYGPGNTYAGGLIGYLSAAGSVINCYTITKPSVNIDAGYKGALIGFNSNGNIINCYYDDDKIPSILPVGNDIGGANVEGKSTEGMKERGLYINWDFINIWGINNNYPYLRTQPLRLDTIIITPGTLVPKFHHDSLIYTVDVDNDEISITATPPAIAGVTVTTVTNPHNLKPGKNPIEVKITHHGGELIYTLNVHRKYQLDFDAQCSGSNPSNIDVVSGINKLPVPTCGGYDFVGWNTKQAGDSIAYDSLTVQDAIGITTLYAQWKPKQYTVRFDANASGITVSPDSKIVTFGDPVGDLPAPTAAPPGYDFAGWNTKPDSAVGDNYYNNTPYNIPSDTIFYAKWQAQKYTLTFNLNGGESVSPTSKTVKYDSLVGSLPTPKRSGWKFIEWNTKADGVGTKYDSTNIYKETNGITIFAIWKSKTYTIKFDPQGGTPQPGSITIPSYEASVGTLPTLDPRPNYKFNGWNTTPDGKGEYYSDDQHYKIDDDTTFYAIWTGDKYYITFDINYDGGINPSPIEIKYDEVVGKLDKPTRTGYAFKGWYTQENGTGEKYDSGTVYKKTQDIILYAKWDANKYKLTFDPGQGLLDPAQKTKTVTYDAPVGELPTPLLPNFTLVEWNTLSDGTGDTYDKTTVYLVEGNTTIYAQWKGTSYQLTFKPGDGGTVNPPNKSVSYGDTVGTLPKPMRKGYEFKGWFTGENGGGTEYIESTPFVENDNIELYANWEALQYKLYFNSNEGGPHKDSLLVTYGLRIGDEFTTKSGTFNRPNYTVAGWNTKPDGSGDTYDKETLYTVVGNTTLYVQWKGVDITVKFDASPLPLLDYPEDRIVAYDSPIGKLPTDIRPGYDVVWKDGTNPNPYNPNTIVKPATGVTTITLAANWTPKKYILTFDPQIGSDSPTSKTVTYGANVGELPPDPVCLGYTFAGWFTGKGGSGTQYHVLTPYNVPDNSTVYAKWECTITFDVVGTSSVTPPPQTVVYDAPVGTLPSALTPVTELSGYSFDGWNTQKDGTGDTYTEETKATGNVTLYPRWKGLLHFNLTDAVLDELLPQLHTKYVYYGNPIGATPRNIWPGHYPTWYDNLGYTGESYGDQSLPPNGLILYAKWTERKYKITFDLNYEGKGGDEINDIEFNHVIEDYGTFPTVSPRTNYTFNGWNTASDGSGRGPVKQTDKYTFFDDITLYAQWKGGDRTLHFVGNYDGAASLSDKTVEYGAPVGYLHTISRVGYEFINWNDLETGDGEGYTSTTLYKAPSDELTLYAKWKPRVYSLFLDIQDGTPVHDSILVEYDKFIGGELERHKPADRTGYYTFNGWNAHPDGTGTPYTNATLYTIPNDITVYAQWKPVQYTLSFETHGGSKEPSQLVDYNSTLSLPTPTRAGYTFKGWNTANDGSGIPYMSVLQYTATENITLHAQWEVNTYTIAFSNNGGGAITPSDGPINVTYGQSIGTLPKGNRNNYGFQGWNTAQDGSGKEYNDGALYTETDDIILYAQWLGDQYRIAFDANGGAVNPTYKDVNYGSTFGELPIPVRAGYKFRGWTYGGQVYNSNDVYRFTDNITLSARWEVGRYNVIYDINYTGGGYVPAPATNLPYETTVTLPDAITREGYTFMEWNTKADGKGTSRKAGEEFTVTWDTTFYAQWQINKYTVTFKSQEAIVENREIEYDSEIGAFPQPERTGYTLSGWFTAPDGGGTQYDATKHVTGDITLYAYWTINNYTVKCHYNYLATPDFEDFTKPYNTPLILPSLTRAGYTHTGWNTVHDGSGTSYAAGETYLITANTTLYAQWKVNKYTVVFDERGGTAVDDRQVEHNATTGTLPTTTRTGYTFAGWFTTPDGVDKYDVTQPVTGDITLFAQWKILKYTVKCYYNYLVTPDFEEFTEPYNTPLRLPVLKRTGYTHTGWNTVHDGSGTSYATGETYQITADMTLFAQWKVNKYTIAFDEQGGTDVSDKQAEHNSTTGILPTTTRTGYAFAGWFTTPDGVDKYDVTQPVTGDITLFAQWKILKYTVTYHDNYSGVVQQLTDQPYNTKLTLPTLTRAGYTHTGWNTVHNGSGASYAAGEVYAVADDVTLYAQWTLGTYKISFDSQGGTTVGDHPVHYNVEVGNLPVPVRTGYVFSGWFTGDGAPYTNVTVYDKTNSITLYAKWTASAYTLRFDVRDGTIERDSKPVVYGTAVGDLPVPSRSGYEFGGWFTEIDGGGTKYIAATVYNVADNTMLFAKWTLKKYTVIFDSQGGDLVAGISVNYNDDITLSVPSRPGYTFKGWNTSKDGTGISYIGTTTYTIDNNSTLFAQWAVNVYELDFDEQGGNHVNNQSVTYDAVIGALSKPTRTGYTFKGWFTGINGGGIECLPTTIYKVAGNTTLYAFWESTKYELVFDVNYAGGLNPANQFTVYGKSVVSLPTVARPGYTFKEWNTARDGSGVAYTTETVYTETDNMMLYAQWIAGVYIISFEANYLGDIVKPENPAFKNIVYDEIIGELPVLTRAGYIFTGWNTAENGSGETYTKTTIYTEPSNIILYAQWVGIGYTASFTGDNVEIDPQPVTYGTKIVRPSDPTLQGYAFGGWYKDNDLWDFNTPVTGDVLLKAKWLSNDSQLKSLTMTQGKMSPTFSPSLTDYTVLLSYDIATVSVTGMPRHSNASVTGNVENASLAVGDNIISIEVTAEDGVNKTIYRILVTRADHIIIPEANLVDLLANDKSVTIEGNTLEYVAACGETSFTLKPTASSPHASIFVNDSLYSKSKGLEIEMTGDVTKTYIHIVSETGVVKDYVLTTNKALYSDKLYHKPWPDVLSIIANPKNNNGYEILGYRWYRHDGRYVGNKGFINIESTGDYAEIRTVQTEGWRRVCGTPMANPTAKITAYPNPVSSGESVKLELPEQYVGGILNIYSITGAMVKSRLPLPSSANSIDVSNLGSGIYLFNITDKDGGNRQSVKIIVE
jgi:uncharacterized repeat protein (TIGR02543 family)